MTCKICESKIKQIFTKKVLNRYDVGYFRCDSCGFVQTEEPHWIKEAYSSAITNLDIGLLSRNNFYSPIVCNLINALFDRNAKFIDFGGGYGVFVRLLRDAGYDYYRYDIYCENIFAKGFDVSDIEVSEKFELLTAFEVFEHLENPLAEVERMLKFSDSLLFSTELVPSSQVSDIEKWWYIAPETGQHLAFYTRESLTKLAKHFGLNLYTNGSTLHLLTPMKINPLTFKALTMHKLTNLMGLLSKKKSLLSSDYDSILSKLTNK